MTLEHRDAAERGLHEASIIAGLLIIVGAGDNEGKSDACTVEWLGQQLHKAIDLASDSLEEIGRMERP